MSLQKQQLVWTFYLPLVSTETCEYFSLMDINAVHSSGENFVSFVVVTNQNCIIFRALMILLGCPELVKYVCGLVTVPLCVFLCESASLWKFRREQSLLQPHCWYFGGNSLLYPEWGRQSASDQYTIIHYSKHGDPNGGGRGGLRRGHADQSKAWSRPRGRGRARGRGRGRVSGQDEARSSERNKNER